MGDPWYVPTYQFTVQLRAYVSMRNLIMSARSNWPSFVDPLEKQPKNHFLCLLFNRFEVYSILFCSALFCYSSAWFIQYGTHLEAAAHNAVLIGWLSSFGGPLIDKQAMQLNFEAKTQSLSQSWGLPKKMKRVMTVIPVKCTRLLLVTEERAFRLYRNFVVIAHSKATTTPIELYDKKRVHNTISLWNQIIIVICRV